MQNFNFNSLKEFDNLRAESFQHPWDRQAVTALQSIPGFEFLVKKLMEIGFEQFFRMTNLASNIHLTGKMLPEVQYLLEKACNILSVPKPDLYLQTSPLPNAYTYGDTNPFVVVTSGLLDLMEPEELLCVFAHEVGHIKCGHVLYKTMARHFKFLLELASQATLGFSSLISGGLQVAMFDWERKSELSADRAALIAVQSQSVVNRMYMKLAGATSKYASKLDEKEFFAQIRNYEDATDESFLNKAFISLVTIQMSHPFVIVRAKHLDNWITSGEFTKLTDIPKEEVHAF